jgi:Zinc-binding dehydrogenase
VRVPLAFATAAAIVTLADCGRNALDRTYPLAEVATGLSYVEQGHARGKVVVTTA